MGGILAAFFGLLKSYPLVSLVVGLLGALGLAKLRNSRLKVKIQKGQQAAAKFELDEAQKASDSKTAEAVKGRKSLETEIVLADEKIRKAEADRKSAHAESESAGESLKEKLDEYK